MVRAPRWVCRLWMVGYPGALASTTERMPSPLEAKASLAAAFHPAASGPSPMAGLARTLPVFESTTDILLPSQTGKRRAPATSKARPLGESQPDGHSAVI